MLFQITTDTAKSWSSGSFSNEAAERFDGGFGNENAMLEFQRAKQKCGKMRIFLQEITETKDGISLSTVTSWQRKES